MPLKNRVKQNYGVFLNSEALFIAFSTSSTEGGVQSSSTNFYTFPEPKLDLLLPHGLHCLHIFCSTLTFKGELSPRCDKNVSKMAVLKKDELLGMWNFRILHWCRTHLFFMKIIITKKNKPLSLKG